jgi:hypothetical protein
MATKTHVVIFKETMDRNAQPEIFTCSAAEANEIEELLGTVENEGSGPDSNSSSPGSSRSWPVRVTVNSLDCSVLRPLRRATRTETSTDSRAS